MSQSTSERWLKIFGVGTVIVLIASLIGGVIGAIYGIWVGDWRPVATAVVIFLTAIVILNILDD